MYIYVLTCKKTGHLLSRAVVCGPLACSTHVGLQGAKWQQLSAVVHELVVDEHEACIACEVSEIHCQLILRAVHLAQVQKRRQAVDLLPLVCHATKIGGRITSSTYGCRPEDRDAAVHSSGQTRVAGGNLCR